MHNASAANAYCTCNSMPRGGMQNTAATLVGRCEWSQKNERGEKERRETCHWYVGHHRIYLLIPKCRLGSHVAAHVSSRMKPLRDIKWFDFSSWRMSRICFCGLGMWIKVGLLSMDVKWSFFKKKKSRACKKHVVCMSDESMHEWSILNWENLFYTNKFMII